MIIKRSLPSTNSHKYELGHRVANGLGVPQDDNEAIQLWKFEAEGGDAAALGLLVAMFHHGSGILQDDKEALKWIRLGVKNGVFSAIYDLGIFYKRGIQVPQDYKEAVRLFRLAALQGNYNASYNLGERYANGQGVPQNDKEATMWFKHAAIKRHPYAKLILENTQGNYQPPENGSILTYPYDFNLGLEAFRKKNLETAYYIWLRLAEQGNTVAQYQLSCVEINYTDRHADIPSQSVPIGP